MTRLTTERIGVAIPWNLSRYIPLNGFRPLYQSLFEDNSRLTFNAIDQVALAKNLQTRPTLRRTVSQGAREAGKEFRSRFAGLPLVDKFIDHLSVEELWATQEIPGDIELHHTSPLTAGTRPFVLHCESFLPVFFPFLSQGRDSLENYKNLRQFYGALLGSSACMAVMSHMPGTLNELSKFFRDPAIDGKLVLSKVGLSQPNLEFLLQFPRQSVSGKPIFLFTNSAHQHAASFGLRGGYVALRFAERYLRSGLHGEFIFRTARPTDEQLRLSGVDVQYLKSMEQNNILWLESYLPENMVLKLFALADVLLLPSVNLHSATLMQALAAGSIPVVTDTYGVEEYVRDDKTGIILKGVRDSVWTDHESGVRVDRHKDFPKLLESLVDQLFHRITPLLENPERVAAMRVEMRKEANRRFSGLAFRDQVTDEILRRSAKLPLHGGPATRAARSYLLRSLNVVHRDGWEKYFHSPPVPVLSIYTGHRQIYSGMGAYYCIAGSRQGTLDQWSPIILGLQGRLGRRGTELVNSEAALGDHLFQRDASSLALTRRVLLVKELGRHVLLPHPRLYRACALVFRFMFHGLFARTANRFLEFSRHIRDRLSPLGVKGVPQGTHRSIKVLADESIAQDDPSQICFLETFKGFNLVGYRNKIFAVPQKLGPIKSHNLEPTPTQAVLKGRTLREMRTRISSAKGLSDLSGLEAIRKDALRARIAAKGSSDERQ
jgi:hypothetical protein